MIILLCIIAYLLLLIEINLSHIYIALDKIADNSKAIGALGRSTDRIENRLYAIERQMGKEVDE